MTRRKRIFWTLASLCCVFSAYMVYAWGVVPFVLPDAADLGSDYFGIEGEPEVDANLASLFPATAWERGPINKIAVSNDILVLFQKHEKSSDGKKLIVKPCTILFLPTQAELSLETRYRQAVVMQASEYAELRFKQPISITGMKPEHFDNGEMVGNVSIRRRETTPGSNDDLSVDGRNIEFNLTQVRTKYPIDFRYGKSTGRGEDLLVVLSPYGQSDVSPESKKSMNIKSIELSRLEFMDIIVPANVRIESEKKSSPELASAVEPAATNTTATPTDIPAATTPDQKTATDKGEFHVSVRCTGKVDFLPKAKSIDHWIARFLERVDVTRTAADGAIDQLKCHELHIEFGQPPAVSAANQSTLKSSGNLSAKKTPPDNANVASITPESKSGIDGKTALDIDKEAKTKPGIASMSALKPLKVLAIGDPSRGTAVDIYSPKNAGFHAKGRKLIFDCVANQIFLDYKTEGDNPKTNADPVSIVVEGGDTTYEIKGKQISYLLGSGGKFGVLEIPGNGFLEGKEKNTGKSTLRARWDDSLQIAPDEDDPAQIHIVLRKRINVDLPGLGTMTAGEADIWCDPVDKNGSTNQPAEKDKTGGLNGFAGGGSYIPQRAGIYEDVLFKKDNVTCNVREMQIYFTPEAKLRTMTPGDPNAPPPAFVSGKSNPAVGVNPAPGNPSANIANRKPAVDPKTGRPAASNDKVARTNQPKKSLLGGDTSPDDSLYDIKAEIMKVSVIIFDDNKSEIDQLKLERSVQLLETPLKGDIIDPLQITGNELLIKRPASNDTEIRIAGEPAVFNGHGADFKGPCVNIFRANNTMTSPSAGKLWFKVPENTQLTGFGQIGKSGTKPKPSAPASPRDEIVTIEWKGNMAFDGKQILFEKNVLARYQAQQIRCDLLSLFLKDRIAFFEKQGNRPEPETIEAEGSVCIDYYQFDGPTQTAYNRAIDLEKIAINVITGEVLGFGSGCFKSTFRSEGKMDIPKAIGANEPKKAADPIALTYAEIKFHDGFKGNFKLREGSASKSVTCLTKPVKKFDEQVDSDDKNKIASEGFVLESNRVAVAQTGTPGDTETQLELTASGSTRIYGDIYTVRAETVKFNQSKDLFIIEGDGFNDATLFRQEVTGGPIDEHHAQRIEYSPKSNKVISNGTRSAGINFGE